MNKDQNLGGMIIGIVLIVIGLLAFFGRYFVLPDMDTLWPLVVIGVGIAFFIPLFLGNKSSGGLAIPGSILVTTGLILFIIFGVIMEFVFSLSGEAHWGGILLWAVLLTLVGVYLLITRLLR